jgi:hypothetical protein
MQRSLSIINMTEIFLMKELRLILQKFSNLLVCQSKE